MTKRILLLSGLCLGGILSAADPESTVCDNMHNLRGLLCGLNYNDDVALKNQINSDFNKACDYLEQVKDKIPEQRYTLHHTWLYKEFLPALKSLSTTSN